MTPPTSDDRAIFVSAAQRFAKSVPNQVEVFDELDEAKLLGISLGIVFHLATWSGPSRVSMQLLADILNENHFFTIPITVADIDGCRYPTNPYHGIRFGGYGEVLWVANGKVQAGLAQITVETKSAAIENCRRLLVPIDFPENRDHDPRTA